MRFCFILEDKYRRESMPTVIARRLLDWGHDVDILEPSKTVTSLCDLSQKVYDAYVLKTVSDGPGLRILEAAAAVGIPTINNPASIRLVRDKSLCAAYAYARGLPFPRSYFVVDPLLIRKIPPEDYPIVVKPTNGSSGHGLYLVNDPTQLTTLKKSRPGLRFFLAQCYVENQGYDIKLYVIGRDVFAVARESPLHPRVQVASRLLPLKPEWLQLARRAGEVFGLDIYGLDVLETRNGPVIVDINDFPSFGHVPRAVGRISDYIVHLAKEARVKRHQEAADRLALQSVGSQTLATADGENGEASSVVRAPANGFRAPANGSRATRTRPNGHGLRTA